MRVYETRKTSSDNHKWFLSALAPNNPPSRLYLRVKAYYSHTILKNYSVGTMNDSVAAMNNSVSFMELICKLRSYASARYTPYNTNARRGFVFEKSFMVSLKNLSVDEPIHS